jgi:hypothetical protein
MGMAFRIRKGWWGNLREKRKWHSALPPARIPDKKI